MTEEEVAHRDKLKEIFMGLVEVLDAFERLEKAAADASVDGEPRRWIDRFMKVKKRVENLLAQQKVQRAGFDSFQDELHEVVDLVATAERPANTILEVHEPAYVWFPDGLMRALRKARVVVAVPPKEPGGEGSSSET